jgi:hypothetical protein
VNQFNGMVRSLFGDLVQKRLWPVALAFLVALIAIPLLLSNPVGSEPGAAPVAPATPATGAGGPLSAFQPVVNSEGQKSSQIRKRLQGFEAKDPFKVQGLGGGGGAAGSQGGSVEVVQEAASGGDEGGAGTGSGDAAPTPSPGTSTGDSGGGSSSPGIQYFQFTVDVRFGKGDSLDKKRLEQFRALPSSENPVVVFMGVRTDAETAVFLVSSASSTTGEGNCEPDDTCTFLYMKAGETQSFEAIDGSDQVVTYTLKLLNVNVEKADAPKGADASDASRNASRSQQRETFTRRIGAIGF